MKALIKVIRKTEYASIVEMSQADFDRLQKSYSKGSRLEQMKAEKELNGLIDTRDWQDDELESVDEFEEFKEK